MDPKDFFANKIFTVSEFNGFLNGVLAPMDVVVEGEVADFRVGQGKFAWFCLKDATDILQCFALVFKLRQPIEDGMTIKVYGHPRVHPKSGKFSLTVEHVELSGVGSIKRAFEMLQQKLAAEGLFDAERKRRLPAYPQHIALVTSPEAAAYSDFIKHINERMGGLRISFLPAAVQGKKAIPEIVAALQRASALAPDVIVLTRGGGSGEDLQEFNAEEVVRAVFASAVPVVAAIGHERDVTLAELAADVRAATPTAAAQLVVPDRAQVQAAVERASMRLAEQLSLRLQRAGSALTLSAMHLSDAMAARVSAWAAPAARFDTAEQLFGQRVIATRQRLAADTRLLASLSPQATLKRGYSIVRKHGKIVKTNADLMPGDAVNIAFSRGQAAANITETYDEKNRRA